MYTPRGIGELSGDRLAFCQAYSRGEISAFVAPADCLAAGYVQTGLKFPDAIRTREDDRLPVEQASTLGTATSGLKWLAIGGGLVLFLTAFQGARR